MKCYSIKLGCWTKYLCQHRKKIDLKSCCQWNMEAFVSYKWILEWKKKKLHQISLLRNGKCVTLHETRPGFVTLVLDSPEKNNSSPTFSKINTRVEQIVKLEGIFYPNSFQSIGIAIWRFLFTRIMETLKKTTLPFFKRKETIN